MAPSDWIPWTPGGKSFVEKGYCTLSVTDTDALKSVRRAYVDGLRAAMPGGKDFDDEAYFNRFHDFADMSKLNDARVRVIRDAGSSEEVRRAVYRCVAPELTQLIGPEVAMQRHVNLVLQLPNDSANLLYLHTDSWSGCSPFEVIAWIPLVDVHTTKTMYICPRGKGERHLLDLRDGPKLDSAEALFAKVEKDVEPVTLKFGEALLFSPTLLHGARENKTNETRAILNVRFKALFSPYGTKTLGETFMPINYLPATEVGLAYEGNYGMVRG